MKSPPPPRASEMVQRVQALGHSSDDPRWIPGSHKVAGENGLLGIRLSPLHTVESTCAAAPPTPPK